MLDGGQEEPCFLGNCTFDGLKHIRWTTHSRGVAAQTSSYAENQEEYLRIFVRNYIMSVKCFSVVISTRVKI